MSDVRVDSVALGSFGSALSAHTGTVGVECGATVRAIGSGIVQDALGNVSVVLTILDRGLADGAAVLVGEARAVEATWVAADHRLAPRPW